MGNYEKRNENKNIDSYEYFNSGNDVMGFAKRKDTAYFGRNRSSD